MLQGEPRATLAVASLGFRPRPSFSFSGDVSYGVNPQYKKEVRGLLRLEFRFGGAQ